MSTTRGARSRRLELSLRQLAQAYDAAAKAAEELDPANRSDADSGVREIWIPPAELEELGYVAKTQNGATWFYRDFVDSDVHYVATAVRLTPTRSHWPLMPSYGFKGCPVPRTWGFFRRLLYLLTAK